MSKTAIVVGGTGGIGRSIVSALEGKETRVAVISRGANHTSDSVLASNYSSDITDEADIAKVLGEIRSELGKIDYVIYAAGLPPDVRVPLLQYSLADWDRTFDLYVKSFLVLLQHVLPHMNEGGHVVALGSAITRFPSDSLPPIFAGHYAAAKAALVELVKWARREAHSQGTLLSLIAPGAVDTAIHQNSGALAQTPKRLLPVTVVADAVVAFLFSRLEGDLELVA